MKKCLTIIALAIFSTVLSAQTFTEILGRPTNNSITINVLFSAQVDVYFEYGTVKGVYSNSTSVVTSTLNEPVVSVMSGLLPETRYYYRTRYRATGTGTFLASSEHTFITQRKPGSKFVFTVEADPHPYDPKGYHPLWDICLQNQLNDGADFMLDLGDTFGDDHLVTSGNPYTTTQIQQLMLDNRPHFGLVCHSLPFFFCEGNHEGESGYYLLQTPPNNIAVYETLWRKKYYPNPEPDGFYSGNNTVEDFGMGKPENYYAFQWGDALFVVIDAWRYYTANNKPRNWDWTIGKTQYDWLKQTLETSTAKYKFVFCHHVMGETRGGVTIAKTFEWGGLDNGTNKFAANRPGWAMPIHQLMVANHVNMYFQGHDHVYARETLDSLVYQTVPMPSDSSYSLGYIANGAAFTGTVLKGAGHIRVTVSTDSLKVDYVNAKLPKDETTTSKNGDIIYSYGVKSSKISALNDIFMSNYPTWMVYPNPANESINFTFNQPLESNFEIRIINLEGKLIRRIDKTYLSDQKNILNVRLNDGNGTIIKSGIYIAELIENGQNVSYQKIAVQ